MCTITLCKHKAVPPDWLVEYAATQENIQRESQTLKYLLPGKSDPGTANINLSGCRHSLLGLCMHSSTVSQPGKVLSSPLCTSSWCIVKLNSPVDFPVPSEEHVNAKFFPTRPSTTSLYSASFHDMCRKLITS